MKKTPRILRDFMRLADKPLETRANNVSSSMKNNKYFPKPSPALADLDAAILAYTTSMTAAQYLDRLKISLKNDAKAKLRSILSALAYYVESVAQGDKTILMSSGFKISSETTGTPAVDKIERFKVTHGINSGDMKLSAARVKGADTYSFYYGIDKGADTVYQHVTKTTAKTTISGLEVGKAYSFYIEAIGSNEKYIQSAIITKVVS